MYIDRSGGGEANVFVKFTSQLSGLRVSFDALFYIEHLRC